MKSITFLRFETFSPSDYAWDGEVSVGVLYRNDSREGLFHKSFHI
jgi:hypothetical protein